MAEEEQSKNVYMEEVVAEGADNQKVKSTRKIKPKREFPQHSIEESKAVLEVIKEKNAGNPWAPSEVATALEMGKGNNFFYLTASSRDYGLTVGTRDTPKIEIGEIGQRFAYPKTPEEEFEAVKEAFLNVVLFKKVYEYYQGQNLPEIQYLKNTLKTEFGVDETLQDEFYELYQKNLKYINKIKSKTGVSDTDISVKPETKMAGSSIVLGESQNAGSLVAFVAMPFTEKTSNYPEGYFDEVLKHLITPAAVRANFNAKTAKKSGSEVIQSTIVNDLDAADLVIVDLTEHNPNVLFELGMRIAFNKPVCLIRAKGTAPIFDIDHMLRVYDYNPCLWPSTLEQDIPALTEHIAETWKNNGKERSYLSLLRENK
ncbi:MAG: hypothetical protein Q8Q40_09285 [Methylococcaceae bacterium]|nr:hypothetical protein [Methylococcaceae bacterium]MDP3904158.1 hypothetical protein [Methylococcaceae bacterium]